MRWLTTSCRWITGDFYFWLAITTFRSTLVEVYLSFSPLDYWVAGPHWGQLFVLSPLLFGVPPSRPIPRHQAYGSSAALLLPPLSSPEHAAPSQKSPPPSPSHGDVSCVPADQQDFATPQVHPVNLRLCARDLYTSSILRLSKAYGARV